MRLHGAAPEPLVWPSFGPCCVSSEGGRQARGGLDGDPGLLESELETGDIPTKTKVVYWLQGRFLWAMPKKTRTEYVDAQGW
jgi:hypothetical protein